MNLNELSEKVVKVVKVAGQKCNQLQSSVEEKRQRTGVIQSQQAQNAQICAASPLAQPSMGLVVDGSCLPGS